MTRMTIQQVRDGLDGLLAQVGINRVAREIVKDIHDTLGRVTPDLWSGARERFVAGAPGPNTDRELIRVSGFVFNSSTIPHCVVIARDTTGEAVHEYAVWEGGINEDGVPVFSQGIYVTTLAEAEEAFGSKRDSIVNGV